MKENYKIITIHGRLRFQNNKKSKLNWYDGEVKYIEHLDFMFVLNNYDFFEKYKQIQDSNDLEFLKIIKIEDADFKYETLY